MGAGLLGAPQDLLEAQRGAGRLILGLGAAPPVVGARVRVGADEFADRGCEPTTHAIAPGLAARSDQPPSVMHPTSWMG